MVIERLARDNVVFATDQTDRVLCSWKNGHGRYIDLVQLLLHLLPDVLGGQFDRMHEKKKYVRDQQVCKCSCTFCFQPRWKKMAPDVLSCLKLPKRTRTKYIVYIVWSEDITKQNRRGWACEILRYPRSPRNDWGRGWGSSEIPQASAGREEPVNILIFKRFHTYI